MSEGIKCTTRGIFSLHGLNAACSHVIVGGKFCGMPYGGCHLQAAPEPSASVGMEPVINSFVHGPLYSAGQLATLQAKLVRVEIEKTNWLECARMHANNQEFYHNIVKEIGEKFGECAYVSDDGSVQDDVLSLKVPELVDRLQAKLEQAEKDKAGLRMIFMNWAEQADINEFGDFGVMMRESILRYKVKK